MSVETDSAGRFVLVAFDVPIDAMAPQSPIGWQVKVGAAFKTITTIETVDAVTVKISYLGAPTADRVIWTGSGAAPIATGGGAAAAFDLPSPWP